MDAPRHCRRCGVLLEQHAGGVCCPACLIRIGLTADDELIGPGTRLGPYEVVALLGGGGMGQVYRARDLRLDRTVAIKVLREPGLISSADRQKRFVREARAASALSSPHIITIHDVGDADGVPFIVMEYVEGRALDAVMRAGRLRLEEILDFSAQIADALAATHAAGIVHRDLKPSNILVTPEGRIKIVDFGVAKLLDTSNAGPPLTGEGVTVGTLEYMSPEQAEGRPTDARSDIFSFGAVLYEMLTGTSPFQRDSRVSTLNAILRDDLTFADETGRALPHAVERLVRRCLEKDPARRYQAMADVRAAIEELPASARGPEALARREWGLRHVTRLRYFSWRRGWLAGSAFFVLALAGYGTVHRIGREVEADGPLVRSLAVLPLESLTGAADEYLADGMTEALVTDLAKIDALRVISRTSVMRFKGTREPVPRIARMLKVDAVLEGSVLRDGNRIRLTAQLIDGRSDEHLWTESYERELYDVIGLQRELATAVARAVHVRLTPTQQARLSTQRGVAPDALDLYFRGRAVASRERRIEYFEEAIRRQPDFAEALAAVAVLYARLSVVGAPIPGILPDPGPAGKRALLAKAEAAARHALQLDASLAEAQLALAGVARAGCDWPAAEAALRRAVELAPANTEARIQYADFLSWQGRHQEAVREALVAHDLNPLSASSHEMLGSRLFAAGRYAEAVAQARLAIELQPASRDAHLTLARVAIVEQRYDDAIAAIHRAMAISGNRWGSLAWLGLVYGLAGRAGDASAASAEIDRHVASGDVSWWLAEAMRAWIAAGTDAEEAALRLQSVFGDGSCASLIVLMDAANDPSIGQLHASPTFRALAKQAGVPGW